MKIIKLSHDELLRIYGAYSPLYFPSEELKPVSTVERLLEKEIYHAYGYYDGEQLLAYACLIQVTGQSTVLLDYYAVLEQFRSGGIGGSFLQELAEALSGMRGIYIESENPDFASDDADRQLRSRRVAFYKRNGAFETGLLSCLFDINYTILFLPCGLDTPQTPDWHYAKLNDLYLAMFSEKHYEKKVSITKS